MMKEIFEDIRNRMETKELVTTFLLTTLFLFLSFVTNTKFSTTEITYEGEKHVIHISYYGFPFQMVGILNPLTDMEYLWIEYSGGGFIRLLWDGLLLNFTLYFIIAFFIVYFFRRLIG